jgi:MFS family permease
MVSSPAGSRTRSAGHWWWLGGTVLAVLAARTPGSALSAVLPDLLAQGIVDFASLRWLVNLGVLLFAVGVAAGALAGELLGHVRVQLAGLACFTLASLLGAVAGNRTLLLLAVAGQGAGAALVVPQLVGYARRHLGPVDRAFAYALFALAFLAGPALGAPVNLWLTPRAGWHALFWLLAAVGLVAAGTAAPLLREPVPVRFDPYGTLVALLVTSGAIGVMLPLTAREPSDWPDWYRVPLALGILLLLGALALDARRRGVRAGLGAPLVALLTTAGAAHLPMLEFYVQLASGQSAGSAALLGVPLVAGALLGTGAALLLLVWVDGRVAVVAGTVLAAAGAALELVVLDTKAQALHSGLLALDATAIGLGLTPVLAGLVRDAPLPTRTGPGAVFTALLIGTAGGAALDEALASSANAAANAVQVAAIPDRLHDATGAVLAIAIGLLLGAAVLAPFLAPRGAELVARDEGARS